MKYILFTIVLLSSFAAMFLKLQMPEFVGENPVREFVVNAWLFVYGAVAAGGLASYLWFLRR